VKHQEEMTPEAFAFSLLTLTSDVVSDNSQALKEHLNVIKQSSKLPRVEEELFFFFVFALDYWLAMGSRYTKEEKDIVRQAFYAHLANILSLNTMQERLITYAQIVNEEKGDEAKFFGFGSKLSKLCGMPGNPHLLVLAPHLFTEALQLLTTLEHTRLKMK